MKPELAAHTPPAGDPDRWDGLAEHSMAVARTAERFAQAFGGAELSRVLGLVHDAGKANPRFQRYLADCARGLDATSVPHAAPGASAVQRLLGSSALAVLGHHAGLHDMAEVKAKLDDVDQEAVRAATGFLNGIGLEASERPPIPDWARKNPTAAELFLRLCFSALVDADYLETERHFDPAKLESRSRYEGLAEYKAELDAHLDRLLAQARPSMVNAARADILAACRRKAALVPGVFRLTVPTGGGKTLSGLSFALDHAVHAGMDRVIVAIPYTSIIDQTALVYADIFGGDAVLEHHSAVGTDDLAEGQSETEALRRLSAENWDCPLIVSTTVQLFESLLANKPARCRKLHNIARSVIILDEVQTLPPACLGPILDVLNELVTHYGCSVVLCTATQPDYSGIDSRLVSRPTEIVDDYREHFATLKRVGFQIMDDEWTAEVVAGRVDGQRQILVVLNTRKDALAVANACKRDDSLFHLSTLMCGHHRKRAIAEVRQRLKEGLQVRLVSTQVVEAGVDFDFPVVMRDIGPLDRIIQVAGRCNREGRRAELGECIVFRLAGRRSPRGAYRTFTEVTEPLLEEFGERIDAPEAMEQYFREAFRYTETGSSEKAGDRAEVQKLRADLKYRTVAERFRLIEEDTSAIIAINYDREEVAGLLAAWGHVSPRLYFRRLAPFCVNVYKHDLRTLQSDGLIDEHESGALVYTGPYDSLFGLKPGLPDPADLIA